MEIVIFITLLTVNISYGVIYRLNDSEYLRMPPVYHLDDYHTCLEQTNGIYCDVNMELVSDTPNDLLQMIHEYSEHYVSHFNHTRLHYGICLTKTCKDFLGRNDTVEQRLTLEACLNESFWTNYHLKINVAKDVYCKGLIEPMDINTGDIIAGVFFLCLILLNFIGSLYDFYYVRDGKGNRLLLSFSIKRNWARLVAQGNLDPIKDRLKGINGVRTLCIMIVILAHSPLLQVVSTANPHDLEKTYDNIAFHLFYNGTLIVQFFFIITASLMAFSIRMYAEKNDLKWIHILKGIALRWLRLTPAYAVVLIFIVTWARFMASGPFWETVVGVEIRDCRQDGWLNMLYLNNYIDFYQCMGHTWYLAADMQLYIMGLFICILAKTDRSRKIVLSTLFIIGCLLPAVHTYIQDLDGILIMAPEATRNILTTSSTFNHSYKRGHTNIPCFIIGLALGNLFYMGLKDKTKVKKFKKIGLLYYLTVPVGCILITSGMAFYGDRPRPSIYLRAIIASVVRPFFAVLIALLLIGIVFKFDNFYRRFLEWQGWRVPGRVSYSAYLIHLIFVRIYAGMSTTLARMTMAQCFKEAFGTIFMTFLLAYIFWLLVEAPLNQAILIVFRLKKNEEKKKGDIALARPEIEQRTVEVLDRQ